MSYRRLNVAMMGCGFMGRAHSSAWADVGKYFPVEVKPTLHTVAGLPGEDVQGFANRWGWGNAVTDWKSIVEDEDIDLIDIVSPNSMHSPMAIAAMEAGKIVACEKPISGTMAEANAMANAARENGVRTYVWFCYRHAPAVALARELVMAGRVGRITHANFFYLQDWANGDVPLTWRFKKETAGSGALGDLGAHIVDMARFVTGERIIPKAATSKIIIPRRKIHVGNVAGGITEGLQSGEETGEVTVDDAFAFLAQLQDSGAIAIFQGARQATGNQNQNGFEICGERGSLRFRFENMNILEYYDACADRKVQGWTPIMCTHGAEHPYVRHYWPDAHLIGYQHGFCSQAYSMILDINGEDPVVDLPSFEDAAETQEVLCAVESMAE